MSGGKLSSTRVADAAPPGDARCDTLYDEPAFYRQLFGERSHDLPFYLGLAAELAAPVLELGVGTGRVALPLARAGRSVVGVDRSSAMIEECRAVLARESPEVRRRVDLEVADVRSLDLRRRFGLVIMPFNGLAHFHEPAELDALFAAVRAHLADGGRFAFDVLVPDPTRLAGTSSTVPWFRHPRTGEVCRCDEEVRYDPVSRLVTIESTVRFMEVERPPERLTLRIRQFQPYELERIVARRGFELLARDESLGDAAGYVCSARRARAVGRAGGASAR